MVGGSTEFKNPEALVSTEWLADHLDDGGIRVFDCTTHLLPPTDPNAGIPYVVDNARADYDAGHIPGSAFLDLQADLSDNDSRLRFTYPGHDRVAEMFGALGVGDGTRVVLYSQTTPQWATRVWWMLRAVGFDAAHVLDGGMTKWKLERRPVVTEETVYPAATLTPAPREGLFVAKEEVLAAIGDAGVCTINALRPEQHAGTGGPASYGRPGRIAGSVNVPTGGLLDPETTAFKPAAEIAAQLDAVGADPSKRVITYCGGGIAASATAMMLAMLGHTNVGLYDASMSEWAKDDSLPMEQG